MNDNLNTKKLFESMNDEFEDKIRDTKMKAREKELAFNKERALLDQNIQNLRNQNLLLEDQITALKEQNRKLLGCFSEEKLKEEMQVILLVQIETN